MRIGLLLVLINWFVGFGASAFPSVNGTRPASSTAPVSNNVTFDFTGAQPLRHWRFNGEWTWDSRNSPDNGGNIGTLQMVSAITVGAANYAASPGIYLTAGQSYTLAYRRDAEIPASPYVVGFSSVQDDSNVTPITSFTMRSADEYATLYRQSFSVPTDGVYHLIFKQVPFINSTQPRDRFADVSVSGPGARLAPVGQVDTGPERGVLGFNGRISYTLNAVVAEQANMGLQVHSVADPFNELRQVEYWAKNRVTGTTTLLGQSTTASNYLVSWNNLPIGQYQVTAKLLNANGQGAVTAVPLNVTVAANQLSATSFLGGGGNDEVRAMVYQPDGSLVLAVNTMAVPTGATPTFLNGANAATAGALIRLSGNGRQVLGMVRLANQVVDLATDSQGRLYVAAGAEGSMRVRADFSAIDWRQTYPGQYTHRIDAGPQGYAVVMVADDPNPDNVSQQGNIRIHTYGPTGANLFTVGAVAQNTSDVAIDEASQTVIGTGFTNFRVADPDRPGSTEPVFVPAFRGWDFTGRQKYVAYNWSSDLNSPRFINRPESNMADGKAVRASIGKDGKLYVLFDVDGGNHAMRYDPFDVMLKVRIVGGDDHFTFSDTNAESKAFIGRYEPGTGAYLLGQELTARVTQSTGRRVGNTINVATGNITADAEGRVYVTADAAFGPPLTVDHLPGQYTGGGYAIVLSPDFTRREAAYRVAFDQGRAIAAIDSRNWAYGGSTGQPGLYAVNALKPTASGGTDGYFAVTGGANAPNTAPTVLITSPRNVTTTATPTLSGTATPNAVVTLNGPGSTTGSPVSVTASPTGTWSTSALRFAGGPVFVTALASNTVGTSMGSTTSFTVIAPPTVAISQPANNTANAVPTLSGGATPGAVVLLTLPTSATGGPISLTASPSGAWVASQMPYRFATGVNSITAIATNASGVSSPVVATFTVVSGQPQPTVSIGAPNGVTTTARPSVQGTSTAFAVVTVSGGSGSSGGPVSVTANASGAWSTSAITFPLGANTVSVVASNAGGSSTAVSSTFTVGTTAALLPPTVTISAPQNVSLTTGQPTLNGTGTPDALITLLVPPTATGGPVSLTVSSWGLWGTSVVQFPVGVHSVTAVASNAGGTATAISTFTVAAPTPRPTSALVITTPAQVPGRTTYAAVGEQNLIAGTATPGASLTLTAALNTTGGPVVITADANGVWSTTALVFGLQNNRVTARASVAGGIPSTAFVDFWGRTRPRVAITSPNNMTVGTTTPVFSGTVDPTGTDFLVYGPNRRAVGAKGLVDGTWSTTGLVYSVGPNSATAIISADDIPSVPAVVSFTVLVPPTVTITYPTNVTATPTTTIRGTAPANSVLTLRGPAGTGDPIYLTVSAFGTWATSAMRFPAGVQSVTATATDAGGTNSTLSTFTVAIPPTPAPTIAISAPVNVTVATDTPLLSGTATPSAEVVIRGPVSSTGGPIYLTASSDGMWSTAGIRFASGPNSLTATATSAGNGGTATATASFTVSGCAQMITTKAGNWTDPTVWSCGRVPTAADVVTIRHTVTVPTGTTADALRIVFDATPQARLNQNAPVRLRN